MNSGQAGEAETRTCSSLFARANCWYPLRNNHALESTGRWLGKEKFIARVAPYRRKLSTRAQSGIDGEFEQSACVGSVLI
jgi:hypothetical protein